MPEGPPEGKGRARAASAVKQTGPIQTTECHNGGLRPSAINQGDFMRSFIVAAALALSFAGAANAKVCWDAHHHHMRCAPPRPVAHRCYDAHHHFIACHR